MRVAAAILAAGASRRLGRPKQLLPYRGTTLLHAVTREVCASRCDAIGVVLGANRERVEPVLRDLRVARLDNARWSEGIASSIRTATTWAMDGGCDALVLLVCDQPRVTGEHVDQLIHAFGRGPGPIASRYGGTVGVPAMFGVASFPKLLALTGDTGARMLLAGPSADRALDWPDGELDLDTVADLERLAVSSASHLLPRTDTGDGRERTE